MVKTPKPTEVSSTPDDYPQVTPRDLYPTSDIRFVMVEVGKLTSSVERLIADVKSQSEKVDAIRHQVTFIKGSIWTVGSIVALLVTVLTVISKWSEIVKLFQVSKP